MADSENTFLSDKQIIGRYINASLINVYTHIYIHINIYVRYVYVYICKTCNIAAVVGSSGKKNLFYLVNRQFLPEDC